MSAMQQPRPRLFYFNFRGRGELSRLVMVAAGVDFDDVRFTREQWAQEYKRRSPSGQCPFVELPDGRQLVQSNAIARFFGRGAGLCGSDDCESYASDWAMQQVDDLEAEFAKVLYAAPEQRLQTMEAAASGAGRRLAGDIVAAIRRSGSGFVAGRSLTVGDLAVFKTIDMLLRFPKFRLDDEQHRQLSDMALSFVQQHEELLQHRQRVLAACPRVAAYVQSRPVTPSY